jgi:NAD(P)-dependent dehydrogenase (short-subunit alcohol dehydrogenase family)
MSQLQPTSPDPAQQFRLDGQVAFLSGATGHLGRSMAEALTGVGAHVILNGRRQDALDALASELTSRGGRLSVACFDVTDEVAVGEHVARIADRHGRLDVMVNNASSGKTGTLESTTPQDFEQLYRVNVVAAFHLLQASLTLLDASAKLRPGGASVINIASMYGSVSPNPAIYGTSGANNPPSYGAAKAGMIQLTRYAACHLASRGIRVNCISPGPFPSALYLERDPGFRAQLESKTPMKRIGHPCELQGPLLFLASDASSYVTGANLPVDGGWTAW